MGRVIEKWIKKDVNGKPIIGEFTLSFEYRDYQDESKKVINRFYQLFTGYLMKEKSDSMISNTCYLFDKANRKLFCFQLHPDSKITSLNTPIVIESILQNITYLGKLFNNIYDNDIDNVPLIPLTITTPQAAINALTNWKPACALRYNIHISQCHEIILSETLDIKTMEERNTPDYQIIRSQLEDISLFRKF